MRASVTTRGCGVALLLLAVAMLAGCATSAPLVLVEGTGGSGAASGEALACGEQALPAGWPDLSAGNAEALLAPFLRCASPGDYVALQERVDMPRLVEALDGWSAVRLGALGPIRADAADVLTRKRAAFLLEATERYGHYHAEVFALFVLHSAHDDEVGALLRVLARDKQLAQTLGPMPAVCEELERRGLPLSAHPERAERPGDVLRGLGRAARDALATSPMSDGGRYRELSARWKQLPAPYQEAAHEVERALALRHFSPGSVAVGSFDAVTFGVPLGFYYLVLGTGQGVASLSRGQYEQATRELAPALLLGALYAGGRGPRVLSKPRLAALKERVWQLEARLGVEGLRALARDIQASREAGRFVAVGGVDAAVALGEARGDVARAQAMMARARPEATGSPAGKGASSGKGATVADDATRSSLERSGAAEGSGASPRWWTRRRASPGTWWRPGWRWWKARPWARVCPGTWGCWRGSGPPGCASARSRGQPALG
ncbi:HNH endonuclease [Cystobacter fuscus]